jgi:hypothetical protein
MGMKCQNFKECHLSHIEVGGKAKTVCLHIRAFMHLFIFQRLAFLRILKELESEAVKTQHYVSVKIFSVFGEGASPRLPLGLRICQDLQNTENLLFSWFWFISGKGYKL